MSLRVGSIWAALLSIVLISYFANALIASLFTIATIAILMLVWRKRVFGSLKFGFLRQDGTEVTPFEQYSKVVKFQVWAGLSLAIIAAVMAKYSLASTAIAILAFMNASVVTMPFREKPEPNDPGQ